MSKCPTHFDVDLFEPHHVSSPSHASLPLLLLKPLSHTTHFIFSKSLSINQLNSEAMTDYRDQQTLQHMKAVAPPKGPSGATHVTALLTLLPLGGTLLCLSGGTLACTLVGFALLTPLFILFSPILVPAGITIGLAVTGFLVSGVLGLASLSALAWIVSYFRRRSGTGRMVMEPLDRARQRVTTPVAGI
ncbi:hypothetical protein LUZ60_012868 [Juncus effusus]|nr:hypothetical protein LUZ60_012868 [Juncus effusus]